MAYESMGTRATGTSTGASNYRRVLSASSIEKDRVYNMAGEDLGTVKDMMIDVSSGRVAYVVLSFGGFLGMGDKLFAIPWSKITIDEDQQRLVVDASKETLERAPGFDKDNWPDMTNPEWGTQVHSYYGAKPYWSDEASTMGTRRNLGDVP